MPIYEYKCQACGSIFEIFQKISDQKLDTTACKVCNKVTNVDKIVSSSGFRLKGAGWYVTDFKNKDKQTKTSDKNQPNSKINK